MRETENGRMIFTRKEIAVVISVFALVCVFFVWVGFMATVKLESESESYFALLTGLAFASIAGWAGFLSYFLSMHFGGSDYRSESSKWQRKRNGAMIAIAISFVACGFFFQVPAPYGLAVICLQFVLASVTLAHWTWMAEGLFSFERDRAKARNTTLKLVA